MLLIECYIKYESQYEDGKLTQDKFYGKVAEELMFVNSDIFEEDKKIIAKQCKSQMDVLKKKYKQILKIHKKSGNGREYWKYFDVLLITF